MYVYSITLSFLSIQKSQPSNQATAPVVQLAVREEHREAPPRSTSVAAPQPDHVTLTTRPPQPNEGDDTQWSLQLLPLNQIRSLPLHHFILFSLVVNHSFLAQVNLSPSRIRLYPEEISLNYCQCIHSVRKKDVSAMSTGGNCKESRSCLLIARMS